MSSSSKSSSNRKSRPTARIEECSSSDEADEEVKTRSHLKATPPPTASATSSTSSAVTPSADEKLSPEDEVFLEKELKERLLEKDRHSARTLTARSDLLELTNSAYNNLVQLASIEKYLADPSLFKKDDGSPLTLDEKQMEALQKEVETRKETKNRNANRILNARSDLLEVTNKSYDNMLRLSALEEYFEKKKTSK
jgi:small-conductance mechanosensitive channel